MRLLHTTEFRLEFFVDDNIPEYVILSHMWGKDEVTFQDICNETTTSEAGWSKIAATCAQARKDGYTWVWIDCCCIDKSSSAELSESINSMWKWYQRADICYAFLSDVDANSPVDTFEKSRWWTRGWTLQELIAPNLLEFYSKDWEFLGTKRSRVDAIESITNISRAALMSGNLSGHNAAEKMSWASHRQCSRPEDVAYCLLGIFGINLPLLYGEGKSNAFFRLQTEILRRDADESLYLFSRCGNVLYTSLLAEETWQFCRSPSCLSCNTDKIFTCLDKGMHYNQIQKPKGDGLPGDLNCHITISNSSVRGSFRILDAKSMAHLITERERGEVWAILVLNIRTSSGQHLAILLGSQPIRDVKPAGYNIYRLAGQPKVVSSDVLSYQSKHLEIRSLKRSIGRAIKLVVELTGNESFKLLPLPKNDACKRPAKVLEQSDHRLAVTIPPIAWVQPVKMVVQDPITRCALLLVAEIPPYGTTALNMKQIQEVAYQSSDSGPYVVPSSISTEDRKEETADYCVLKLQNSHSFEIRLRRRAPTRDTSADDSVKYLNYQIHMTRLED